MPTNNTTNNTVVDQHTLVGAVPTYIIKSHQGDRFLSQPDIDRTPIINHLNEQGVQWVLTCHITDSACELIPKNRMVTTLNHQNSLGKLKALGFNVFRHLVIDDAELFTTIIDANTRLSELVHLTHSQIVFRLGVNPEVTVVNQLVQQYPKAIFVVSQHTSVEIANCLAGMYVSCDSSISRYALPELDGTKISLLYSNPVYAVSGSFDRTTEYVSEFFNDINNRLNVGALSDKQKQSVIKLMLVWMHHSIQSPERETRLADSLSLLANSAWNIDLPDDVLSKIRQLSQRQSPLQPAILIMYSNCLIHTIISMLSNTSIIIPRRLSHYLNNLLGIISQIPLLTTQIELDVNALLRQLLTLLQASKSTTSDHRILAVWQFVPELKKRLSEVLIKGNHYKIQTIADSIKQINDSITDKPHVDHSIDMAEKVLNLSQEIDRVSRSYHGYSQPEALTVLQIKIVKVSMQFLVSTMTEKLLPLIDGSEYTVSLRQSHDLIQAIEEYITTEETPDSIAITNPINTGCQNVLDMAKTDVSEALSDRIIALVINELRPVIQVIQLQYQRQQSLTSAQQALDSVSENLSTRGLLNQVLNLINKKQQPEQVITINTTALGYIEPDNIVKIINDSSLVFQGDHLYKVHEDQSLECVIDDWGKQYCERLVYQAKPKFMSVKCPQKQQRLHQQDKFWRVLSHYCWSTAYQDVATLTQHFNPSRLVAYFSQPRDCVDLALLSSILLANIHHSDTKSMLSLAKYWALYQPPELLIQLYSGHTTQENDFLCQYQTWLESNNAYSAISFYQLYQRHDSETPLAGLTTNQAHLSKLINNGVKRLEDITTFLHNYQIKALKTIASTELYDKLNSAICRNTAEDKSAQPHAQLLDQIKELNDLLPPTDNRITHLIKQYIAQIETLADFSEQYTFITCLSEVISAQDKRIKSSYHRWAERLFAHCQDGYLRLQIADCDAKQKYASLNQIYANEKPLPEFKLKKKLDKSQLKRIVELQEKKDTLGKITDSSAVLFYLACGDKLSLIMNNVSGQNDYYNQILTELSGKFWTSVVINAQGKSRVFVCTSADGLKVTVTAHSTIASDILRCDDFDQALLSKALPTVLFDLADIANPKPYVLLIEQCLYGIDRLLEKNGDCVGIIHRYLLDLDPTRQRQLCWHWFQQDLKGSPDLLITRLSTAFKPFSESIGFNLMRRSKRLLIDVEITPQLVLTFTLDEFKAVKDILESIIIGQSRHPGVALIACMRQAGIRLSTQSSSQDLQMVIASSRRSGMIKRFSTLFRLNLPSRIAWLYTNGQTAIPLKQSEVNCWKEAIGQVYPNIGTVYIFGTALLFWIKESLQGIGISHPSQLTIPGSSHCIPMQIACDRSIQPLQQQSIFSGVGYTSFINRIDPQALRLQFYHFDRPITGQHIPLGACIRLSSRFPALIVNSNVLTLNANGSISVKQWDDVTQANPGWRQYERAKEFMSLPDIT